MIKIKSKFKKALKIKFKPKTLIKINKILK